MQTPHLRLVALTLLGSTLLLSACTSPAVQDARMNGLNHRQDRVDSRSSARQERWQARSDREDARTEARFDSW